MKSLTNRAFLIIIVALLACIATIVICETGKAQTEGNKYAVSGIYINNGKPYGVFGFAYRASPYLTYFVQSESGGDEQAFSGSPILTSRITRRISIGAMLGPQVEIIQENPDYEEAIMYLGATTGVIGIYEVNERTAIWFGARYLIIDADIKPFKIGAGLIVKL